MPQHQNAGGQEEVQARIERETIAIIATLKGDTICTLSTTKHNPTLINGYPYTKRHANNLLAYSGKNVKVSLGHTNVRSNTIKTIKAVEIGQRITKIVFE